MRKKQQQKNKKNNNLSDKCRKQIMVDTVNARGRGLLLSYEPAYDKTYNDLCDQQRLRPACKSTH